jgi:hypothetical protein
MFQTNVVEKIKTHILCSNISPKIVPFEIMWKNTVQPDRQQMTIRRMRIACWVTKATDTHSEYVIRLFHYNGYTNAPQCHVRTLPTSRWGEFTARLEMNLEIKRITFGERSGDFRILLARVLARS